MSFPAPRRSATYPRLHHRDSAGLRRWDTGIPNILVQVRQDDASMPRYVSLMDAASLLATVERVLVIGCSGGGKTTFSAKIADLHRLEFQSLDRDVRWLPGWIERDRSEQRAIISDMVQRDRWVMDGSGASSFDLRLPRTDLVLWVRVPRWVALIGLLKRVSRFYGSVRPAMAEGCPEPLPDREFLSYIWNFEKNTPRFCEANRALWAGRSGSRAQLSSRDGPAPSTIGQTYRSITQ